MPKITFCKLDKSNASATLPSLFRILHSNMSKIAPTGCRYEEDDALWLSYMAPQMKQAYPEFVLMYVGETLAGYFQYSIEGDTLTVDEVEIIPEYQRTVLFYRLCIYLCGRIPDQVQHVESFVNKQNRNSLKINRKLGLEIAGENRNGKSWHLRGDDEKIKKYFADKVI